MDGFSSAADLVDLVDVDDALLAFSMSPRRLRSLRMMFSTSSPT
jgi:hypothetical protein